MRQLLVSAYGCEPGKGSEQGVGWHWVKELAQTERLWVITRKNNQRAIEDALTPQLRERVHFEYYDLPERLRRLKRREKGLYGYYALWQLGAYRRAREICREVQFDYCIHLTFGSMWMPTFMYRLPVPFIWGPIGGAESVPLQLIPSLPLRARLVQYFRWGLLRAAAINPLITRPASAARAIIARTDDARAVFSARYGDKVTTMLETAMSEDVLNGISSRRGVSDASTVTFAYVGRLVAIKAVDLAIRAVAEAVRGGARVRFVIIGDGPERPRLEALATQLGVFGSISFLGSVTQQEAIAHLQEADVFLFPSLKEGGSWALLEAMAVGLPVICLSASGMRVITNDECAIRLQPAPADELVQAMSRAIVVMAEEPVRRREMGLFARRRVEENFTWTQKGAFMQRLMSDIESGRPLAIER